MSQENVELVRRAYAELGPYLAQVDASAAAGFFAPDIEVDVSAVYSDAPRVRGLEAAIDLTQSMPWGRSTKLEPERFFDVDDERVLSFIRVTAKVRAAASGRAPRRTRAHYPERLVHSGQGVSGPE